MLSEAKLPKSFWPEAHPYSNLVRNRSPTQVPGLEKTTPDEVFNNKKPDVSTLRVFGSKCHIRVPKEKRKKLDPHSLDGIFMGFVKESKAYLVWVPTKRKFYTSRNVIVYEKAYSETVFNEENPPAQSKGVQSIIPTSSDESPDTENNIIASPKDNSLTDAPLSQASPK
jgi:hypothetical protein